ncbi:MAG: NnrU family protein [Maritimibacter sp.]|nr:NnrU family protein [Maritimibacter sp.]
MGWLEYILAFAAFFATHAIPVRPPVKARIVARIGARGFSLAYSALSVAVLAWLIGAAGRAPYVEIWPRAPWQSWVPFGANALAAVIIALAVARPNPLSFGGARNAEFDPNHAGIVGWVRHPLLAAIALWAGAHLLPNGDLAHVILFGTFLGFALLGMKMIDRRKRRQLGGDWARLADTPRRVKITPGGLVRAVAGLALWWGLMLLHGPVIGFSPWP